MTRYAYIAILAPLPDGDSGVRFEDVPPESYIAADIRVVPFKELDISDIPSIAEVAGKAMIRKIEESGMPLLKPHEETAAGEKA